MILICKWLCIFLKSPHLHPSMRHLSIFFANVYVRAIYSQLCQRSKSIIHKSEKYEVRLPDNYRIHLHSAEIGKNFSALRGTYYICPWYLHFDQIIAIFRASYSSAGHVCQQCRQWSYAIKFETITAEFETKTNCLQIIDWNKSN